MSGNVRSGLSRDLDQLNAQRLGDALRRVEWIGFTCEQILPQ